MQLGQTIQNIRKEKNLTQEQFAELFHVTRQTISNWENEKSYPDLFTLIAISDNFDISLDKMLKEDIKMAEKINKEINWAKRTKAIIAVLVSIIVLSAAIWFFVWNHYKKVTEKKFNEGLSNYEYSINESPSALGYYVIKYDANTYFTLPNQKMPGYLNFAVDFHAKDVDCYTELNGEQVALCWSFYDGGGKKNTDSVIIHRENEDETGRKLTDSEIKELDKFLNFGFELYDAVYR